MEREKLDYSLVLTTDIYNLSTKHERGTLQEGLSIT